MALRIASVTIDCRDPQKLEDFWSEALGYVPRENPGSGTGSVVDPRDRDVELVFVQVAEPKAIKNRVHLGIGADDREAEVARLMNLGAERVQTLERWTVMRDPEGNEFCILDVPEGDPLEAWRT